MANIFEIGIDEPDERGNGFLSNEMKRVSELSQVKSFTPQNLEQVHDSLATIHDFDRNSQVLEVVSVGQELTSTTLDGFDSFTTDELESFTRRLMRIIKLVQQMEQGETTERITELCSLVMASCCGEEARARVVVSVQFKVLPAHGEPPLSARGLDAVAGPATGGADVVHVPELAPLDISIVLPCFAVADVGYRIWGAAKVMCCYLMRNPGVVEGKHVLELGAGCGLVGFAAASLGAASVGMTDFNDACIDAIADTADSNHKEKVLSWSTHDWRCEPDVKYCENAQLVIGAAVVYEPLHAELFPQAVVKCVKRSQSEKVEVLISIHEEHSGFDDFDENFPKAFEIDEHFRLETVQKFGKPFKVREDGRSTDVRMYKLSYKRV